LNEGLERRWTEQLRTMTRELTQVEQRERQRLAEILHDHVQQFLLSARLQLSVVNQSDLPLAEREALRLADETLVRAMPDCRTLAMDLSPPILHKAGLGAAWVWLARRMVQRHRFAVDVHIETAAEPLDAELRYTVFRAMRELLCNAYEHPSCTKASVKLTQAPNPWLRIMVEDAGKGFDPEVVSLNMTRSETFGLVSGRQRLGHLGARMELESAPGAGTRAHILAPTNGRGHNGDRAFEGRTTPASGPRVAANGAIRVPAGDTR